MATRYAFFEPYGNGVCVKNRVPPKCQEKINSKSPTYSRKSNEQHNDISVRIFRLNAYRGTRTITHAQLYRAQHIGYVNFHRRIPGGLSRVICAATFPAPVGTNNTAHTILYNIIQVGTGTVYKYNRFWGLPNRYFFPPLLTSRLIYDRGRCKTHSDYNTQ